MTDVPDILQIMKNKGWDEGAALLQHWMNHPSNDDPERGNPNTDTVTIDWTRGFSRAAKVYEEAVQSKIWTTTDARQRLRSVIERRIQDATIKSSLLRVDMVQRSDPSTITMDNRVSIYEDRVAYAPMGDYSVVDALTAALGRFGYYFNVSGGCEPKGNGFKVSIDRVGVYIRDSYDFNDDATLWEPHTWPSQHLGFWDTHQSYVHGSNPHHCWTTSQTGRVSQLFGHSMPFGPQITISVPECGWATRVNNRYFRSYRERTQTGSDFLVYSDIVYIDTDDEFLV